MKQFTFLNIILCMMGLFLWHWQYYLSSTRRSWKRSLRRFQKWNDSKEKPEENLEDVPESSLKEDPGDDLEDDSKNDSKEKPEENLEDVPESSFKEDLEKY